jgi:hypothetical protein
MVYGAGLASVAAFGGAAALPGSGAGWETARLLLDLAGGLFGAYLILLAVVLLGARVMRAQYGETDARP